MSERTPGRTRRWPLYLVGAIVAVVILVVGGTAFYINVIKEDAPEQFVLDDNPGSTTGSGSVTGTEARSADGSWKVTEGSEAGYRVEEVLFGQNTTAAGRTSEVSGTMTIANDRVTEAKFEVQMASVTTDEARRDNQYRTRIMDVTAHPTSEFTLTKPIVLSSVPADGEKRTYQATGTLTLRGTPREVTMDLQAQRSGDQIQVVGQIPVTFADFDIPNPSIPGISTEDHGIMEVSLRLVRDGLAQ